MIDIEKTTIAEIELFRNDMCFSAAHFTIFSGTNRERLHGHSYYVRSVVKAEYIQPGITYDYDITRKKILALCCELHEYTLLPEYSPYLQIKDDAEYYSVFFANEKMLFLKKDTKLLPILNVTTEELAKWFAMKMVENRQEIADYRIRELKISVSASRGQYSSFLWSRDD